MAQQIDINRHSKKKANLGQRLDQAMSQNYFLIFPVLVIKEWLIEQAKVQVNGEVVTKAAN